MAVAPSRGGQCTQTTVAVGQESHPGRSFGNDSILSFPENPREYSLILDIFRGSVKTKSYCDFKRTHKIVLLSTNQRPLKIIGKMGWCQKDLEGSPKNGKQK